MANAISVSGLVKTFGHVRALDGLDLSVATGEVHGFLGPNGAGKSTTIRVLLGLLRADGGEVRLLGGDPWADAVSLHRRLAYVPGDVNLWPNLSGGEAIDLLGRLRGGLDPVRRADLLERFELDPTKKGRTYSKGNRQKVALIAGARVRRRAAAARRADLRARPAEGDGVPGVHPGGPPRGAHRAAVEPHPGRGRGALRPREHHPRGEDGRDREPDRAAPSHADVDRRRDRRAALPGSPRSKASTTSTSTTTAPASTSTPRHLDEALHHLTRLGVRSLTSQPPTLEELFLRHYGDAIAT